jgi:hypothetical protein
VLDAGALIALEKRSTRMEALLRKAQKTRTRVLIPAGALAQAWTGDARQAPIHRLLKRSTTEVPALDRVLAEAAGRLCKQSATEDVVDASVVLACRQSRGVVVTSDPDDLRQLDASLAIEAI